MSDSGYNWQSRPLGELATTTSGGTPSRKRKDYYGGSIPWVKSGELNDDYIFETEEHITEAGLKNSSAKLFPSGTVLIALYGATVGKTSILRINASTNQAICGITPGPDVDADFLRYHLISLRRELLSHRYGGAQPNISQQIVRNQKIAYPPLPEQKKIAHILLTVQRAIEAQEQIIQTTTELKKTLMHKLFTEGLRNEPQKQTEIGPVPESWTPTTLGELCEKPNGALQTGPFGSQLHKHEYQEGGIAVVNPTHLAGNRINHENVPYVSEEVAQRLGKHRLRKFDILFARRGEIGRQGLVSEAEETWLCGTGCFLVRASKPYIDNRFLALYFATDRIVKWLYSHAAGAIMPNLNNSVMQRLPVFYPDLETQIAIIETFATIDQKLSAAVRRQTALQDLFRTLLHELMTAKTRVHDLNLIERR